MAPNFRLNHFQGKDNLHLHMHGDFDGTSAHELTNALMNQNNKYSKVFIDTNNLKYIHNFGIDVFQTNLNMLLKKNRSFIFIGKHKHRFFV
jgi:anti-anti-sigma regulatory factor